MEYGRNSTESERGLFAPLKHAWWGYAVAGASKAAGFLPRQDSARKNRNAGAQQSRLEAEANRGPGESGASSDSSTVNCLLEIRLRVWRQPICGDISDPKKLAALPLINLPRWHPQNSRVQTEKTRTRFSFTTLDAIVTMAGLSPQM